MNTESFTQLSEDEQVKIYQEIHRFLVVLGFSKQSFEEKTKDACLIGLSEPENKRQESANYTASFRKNYLNGHYVVVHTTFDDSLQVFTEDGRFGVLVKRPSHDMEKIVRFQIYFNREGRLLDKVESITTYLNHVLSHVPRGKGNRPMVLVRQKGDPDTWYFKSREGEKLNLFADRLFTKEMVETRFDQKVLKLISGRQNYRNSKSSGAGHIRDIKKIRKATMPENEIPKYED